MINVVNEEIEFCFKTFDEEYISVNKYGAILIGYSRDKSVTFTKFSLEKNLKRLLGNCCFKLGKTFFRRVIALAVG